MTIPKMMMMMMMMMMIMGVGVGVGIATDMEVGSGPPRRADDGVGVAADMKVGSGPHRRADDDVRLRWEEEDVLGDVFRQSSTCTSPVSITMAPGTRAIVESPNFPMNYPTKTRCQWQVTCGPKVSNYLKMNCRMFKLESSTGCLHDRLIVTSKGASKTHCGTDSPNGTVTKEGWARFTFSSNGNKVEKGFRCFIWCFPHPTTTTTTTTPTTTTMITTTATATS
ncbi:deleted in malignant brain tumors 1 protein-like [Homarus americanus]|uniref:deleted in malignant brain tumors 1 protein-like n=1 Tax=Homarus americanus TaxID=6706 RepID=UPI001C46E9ED|nr:deleted in malignant brain tumors 1 protein-like [Homarus americanus]